MKTYSVAITAGGVGYHFHLDNINKVRELFAGSYDITAFEVYEQTDRINERPIIRKMSPLEIEDIIWGRTAKVQILGNAVAAVA
jgi:hypothetical protein